ncbi:hypothetical protein [Piscinibacter sakaiensis]|uniref:Uncharacterized protein n=1 Tax=Piscinibacter sakaiensis TaxID=1547922 RepID=A0A0K8P431_PISS1|nr:hypothetical protein [Piscinibacter sakaiensis]GAP37351.1 hypothetical protein ISF6_3206 [Piscinibacter sakaiensis]
MRDGRATPFRCRGGCPACAAGTECPAAAQRRWDAEVARRWAALQQQADPLPLTPTVAAAAAALFGAAVLLSAIYPWGAA